MNEYERLAQDIDVFLSTIGMADYETYINTSDWQRQFLVFIEHGDIMLSSIHRMLRDAAAAYPRHSDTAHMLMQRLEKRMLNFAKKIAAEQSEPPPAAKVKMENVDVLATMEAIIGLNPTFHRQYDLDTVKEQIVGWSRNNDPEDKHFIWLSYSYGNCCLQERSTFMEETQANNTLFELGSQPGDAVDAYIVDIGAHVAGKVMGDVYAVDYKAYTQHVKECAIPVFSVTLMPKTGAPKPEDEIRMQDYRNLNYPIGGYASIRHNPASEKRLKAALRAERRERQENSVPGKLRDHLRDLSDAMTHGEAKEITISLAGLDKPNSPDGTQYMIKLDPVFREASSKVLSAITRAVPYKGVTIGKVPGKPSLYVLVPQEKELKHGRAATRGANIDDKHDSHYGKGAASRSVLHRLKQPAPKQPGKPKDRKKPGPEL